MHISASAQNTRRIESVQQSKMIKALSAVISDWLLKEGAVESSEKGLFEYAAYSLFFGFLPVITRLI